MFPQRTALKVHWQAPTTIILTFTAGLAFALGHHVLYQSLDGQPVDHHLFNQQTNLAAGQALAFLVRACLVVAVGMSYWQVFWGTILRSPFAMSQVDVLAGLLGSVLDMLNFRVLFSRPALMLLASLAWLIPLASILPPATLSVQLNTTEEFATTPGPSPRFLHTTMASTYEQMNAPGIVVLPDGSKEEAAPGDMHTYYNRPSRPLSRLVTSTAFRGTVPMFGTVHSNSTYTLDFVAPAMQCQPISQDLLEGFDSVTNCSLVAPKPDTLPKAECDPFIAYIAWVPNATALVPFEKNGAIHGSLPLQPMVSTFYDPRYIGGHRDGPASVLVATRSQRQPFALNNWDVLNCSMHNASYSAKVRSNGDSQGVFSDVKTRELNSMQFAQSTSSRDLWTQPSVEDSAALAYTALMECMNRLLVGTTFGSPYSRMGNTIYYEEKKLATQNEGLTQTLLPFTTELLPFLGFTNSLGDYDALKPNDTQWTIVANINDTSGNYTIAYPSEAFQASTFNQSLGRAIEELFRNMTLSLFSDHSFLGSTTENITIRYEHTRNVYVYSSKNLFLSYGLALGFAFLAVVAGCVSIHHNGASYSNKFSTIIRTTRGQEMEDLVASDDRDGADPLPKYLANARIRLGDGESEQKTKDELRPYVQRQSETVSEQTAMMDSQQQDSHSHADHEAQRSVTGE